MALELHVGAPTSANIRGQVEFVQQAEATGFAGVGIADHLEHGHDAYITLAQAAAATSKIQLYPSVTNPVTRHAFTLAALANSLNELAPGRFKLGIGTGDSSVANIGVKPATVARFREVLGEIRALLQGESVTFGTNSDSHIQDPTSPPPPIMVTASGPRALQVAGEFGDEAMLLGGLTEAVRAQAWSHVATGAAKQGRDAGAINLTQVTSVSMDDDAVAARARVWPAVFSWISMGFFNDALAVLGIDVSGLSKPDDASPDLVERLCGEFAVAGTPSQVVDRFHALGGDGVERAYILAFGGGDSRERIMELLAKEVIG